MNSNPAFPAPTWPGLLAALIPILISILILMIRGLGQARSLLIAVARMLVQLSLLGFVLELVFRLERPDVVLGVGLVMLSASALAISSRQSRRLIWIRMEGFVAMGLSVTLSMAVATRLSLRVDPWYAPQVLLPLLGMILGNSVNGISLAADRFDTELRQQRAEVELRLALGASSRQAALPALRAALRAGLTPIINGMMIAGIVSIPGMATGQLLAGADVSTAMRYQMLIYLTTAGTTAPGLLILLRLRFRHYFTAYHQLRPQTTTLNG